MTVWTVHRLKDLDVSKAEVYGELEYINNRYIFSDEIKDGRAPEKFHSRMCRAVDMFDPGHDYMLIAGDHLQMVMFASLLTNRWGEFKVLRFDREAGGYFPVTIGEINVVEG